MNYFTSDWHFGHKNILKYCSRPFSDIGEHDDTLIYNINCTVGKGDNLFFLGDGFFRNPQSYIDRIKCKNIYYILGSHDKIVHKYSDSFKFLGHQLTKSFGEDVVFMSHCAHLVWPKSHYGSIHLYGHSHGNLGMKKDNDFSCAIKHIVDNSLSMDVGVDTNNYFPYSLDQIKELLDKKINKKKQLLIEY